MKGLSVSIYRNAEFTGNYTNGGMTMRHTSAVLCGEGIPEIVEADDKSPALILVKRMLYDDREPGGKKLYLHARPADLPPGTHSMMGGNFIHTSDSRFPNKYPIAVHDRVEP